MKTTINKIVLSVLVATAFTFNSCKKEETVLNNSNNSNAVKETIFKKIAEKQAVSAYQALELNMFISQTLQRNNIHFKTETDDAPCLVITVDSSSSPHTITLDYGSTGCKGRDSVFHSGKIVLEYTTTDINIVGTSIKAIATDFAIDSAVVNGDVTLTTLSSDSSGQTYRLDVNLTTSYSKDLVELTGNSVYNVTFSHNDPTDDTDNTLSFTGSGSGTNNAGVDFTQTINSPLLLKKADGCDQHFVSGVLLIQSPGLYDKEIDYGNGTCDNYATLTSNGTTSTIRLQ